MSKKRLSSRSVQPAVAQMHKGFTSVDHAVAKVSTSGRTNVNPCSTAKKDARASAKSFTPSQVKRKGRNLGVDNAAGATFPRRQPLLRQLPPTLPEWPEDVDETHASGGKTSCARVPDSLATTSTTKPSALSVKDSDGQQGGSRKNSGQAAAAFFTSAVASKRLCRKVDGRETLKSKKKPEQRNLRSKLLSVTFWKDAKNRQILRTIRKSLDCPHQGRGKKRNQEATQDEDDNISSTAQRTSGREYEFPKLQELRESTALVAASTWLSEQMNSTRQRRPVITLERLLRQKKRSRNSSFM